jgi:hypothetical protein
LITKEKLMYWRSLAVAEEKTQVWLISAAQIKTSNTKSMACGSLGVCPGRGYVVLVDGQRLITILKIVEINGT